MRRSDRFDVKTSKLYFVSGIYRSQVSLNSVFFEFIFYKPQCQSRAVPRNLDILEQIWNRTDMVLVAVCDYHACYPFSVCNEIGKIRYDDINSVHFIIREGKPTVYNHYLVIAFEQGHVFSDLIQSADWNNLQFRDFPLSCCLSSSHIFSSLFYYDVNQFVRYCDDLNNCFSIGQCLNLGIVQGCFF